MIVDAEAARPADLVERDFRAPAPKRPSRSFVPGDRGSGMGNVGTGGSHGG